MPNSDWRILCERGRALRAQLGTLDGHAVGDAVSTPVADLRAVDRILGVHAAPEDVSNAGPGGAASIDPDPPTVPLPDLSGVVESVPEARLPEPLQAVVSYLGEDLHRRRFIPTAELVAALGVEPTVFGREMAALGATPRPGRVQDEDGATRQVRGYRTVDLRDAVDSCQGAHGPVTTGPEDPSHAAIDDEDPSQRP